MAAVEPDKPHKQRYHEDTNTVCLTMSNIMITAIDPDTSYHEQSGSEDTDAADLTVVPPPAVVNLDARSSTFNSVSGDQYINYVNQTDARPLPNPVLHKVKKDAALNRLSGNSDVGFFVTLPRFDKSLSEKSLNIQIATETRASSCAFDFARRLGLLPGQPNEEHCEYEIVALDDLVHNGDTYCARVSRHFLVLLITEHVQEVWQVGNRIYASTDIGQFTLYEHEARRLIHFDGSIRTTAGTLIPDQVLEYIQKVARGLYRDDTGKWWKVLPEDFATVHKPLLRVVHYLRRKDIEEWSLLKTFASTLAGIVASIICAVRSPESFATALRKDWMVPGARDAASASERLASSAQIFSIFHAVDMSDARDLLTELGATILRDVVDADQEFLGRPVDGMSYLLRSDRHFKELFNLYRTGHASVESLRQELQSMISPQAENIALVVAQGGLALIAKANAIAVLNMAKEAPEGWIHFVCAEDGDMFIGAAA